MYKDQLKNTLEDVKARFKSDLHTHTLVSGHAYTTFMENVDHCRKCGLKILGTSEHGPELPGSPHQWYFNNIRTIPREVKGITILRGCELNMMNKEGDVDPEFEDYKRSLDYCIASFHEPVFIPSTKEEHTQAIINAVNRNKEILILGHLGNPNYPINIEEIVKHAKEKDIMIEINNSSLGSGSRKGSKSNCRDIAAACKEHGTKIILTSDAHFNLQIGEFDRAIDILDDIDFPEELIMNEPAKLITYLQDRGIAMDIDVRRVL